MIKADHAPTVGADFDELPEEEFGPYCCCDLDPDEEEEASGVCKACGKLIS